MTPYEILGLTEDCKKVDIKHRYRALCKKYRPDIDTSKNNVELFLVIKQAYDYLWVNHIEPDPNKPAPARNKNLHSKVYVNTVHRRSGRTGGTRVKPTPRPSPRPTPSGTGFPPFTTTTGPGQRTSSMHAACNCGTCTDVTCLAHPNYQKAKAYSLSDDLFAAIVLGSSIGTITIIGALIKFLMG
jgi:hypothetical protein